MSAANVQVGTGRGVSFTPSGGSEYIFPALVWSLSRTANVQAMHNSRDGILRKKTLDDASGSVSGLYDTDVEPGVDFATGVTGVLKLYTDATSTRFYSMTAIIDNVSISPGSQTDPMTASFDFALASGTVTNPIG
jgi:hypothetical protein